MTNLPVREVMAVGILGKKFKTKVTKNKELIIQVARITKTHKIDTY